MVQPDPTRVCVPLPVSVDSKDVHIGSRHVHVSGRSNIRGCALNDGEVQGTPTVTRYDNCGDACFAARVSDLKAVQHLSLQISFKEDGKQHTVDVDPGPINLTQHLEDVCISNHATGTPDPCVVNLVSPSNLRAKGGDRQVSLTWKAGGEAYGRNVETVYELWRSTSTDLETFEMVASGLTKTKYVDLNLQRKTSYSYYVVAVTAEGDRSGGSKVATATTK